MPAKGDGISKRKDGRYMARYTVHTTLPAYSLWRRTPRDLADGTTFRDSHGLGGLLP